MDVIYFDDCGVGMMESDLWSWVTSDVYQDWSFDEITGGCGQFASKEVYLRIRERFQNYEQTKYRLAN